MFNVSIITSALNETHFHCFRLKAEGNEYGVAEAVGYPWSKESSFRKLKSSPDANRQCWRH